MKFQLIRTLTGFTPADPDSLERAKKIKPGTQCHGDIAVPRNNKFHRKYMALLKLGFDYWEPPEKLHQGRPILKNFERFREDVAILAGFYTVEWNINGEPRFKAKSIAFANMEEDEFEKLYNATIQVLIDKVLEAKGFNRETLDQVIDELLRFD